VVISQAAGTGYVFGAYIAVSCPNRPAPGNPAVNVPDLSGASFMFSLINEYQRPFRLSLTDRTRAIRVNPSAGPAFGGQNNGADGKMVKFSNLMLMFNGKDANDSCGNGSNDAGAAMAYQLNAWASGPPIGFKLDSTTLAGQQYFAIEEMEVYAMSNSSVNGGGNLTAPTR
jgi:hypothetical protein